MHVDTNNYLHHLKNSSKQIIGCLNLLRMRRFNPLGSHCSLDSLKRFIMFIPVVEPDHDCYYSLFRSGTFDRPNTKSKKISRSQNN